jgi:outer membrane protein OmpA-like peptidoglycan-associated protein
MKKFLFSLIVVCLASASIAQTPTSYKKRASLGVAFFLNDMYTAEKISRTSLSRVLQSGGFTPMKDLSAGLSLQYFEGISEHVDFMATLSGSYSKYPFYFKTGLAPSLRSLLLVEADANVNVKLLSDKYTVVPYVTLGVGASMYNGTYFAAQGNTGLGLQFNIGGETFINTQMLYRPAISGLAVNHTAYSVGFASPIKDKPAPVLAPPPPAPNPVAAAPVDTDKDGINDKDDKCPTVAGVAKYNGCPVPDSDRDGINDENDKCPTAAGIAKYNGCPIPDTDKDGVNDEADKCPTVPGLARYQGCPIPDSDGDGVNDEEDKCPSIKGTRENNGCPELKATYNFDNKKVQFVSGSAVLTKVSTVELKKVVKALNENPTLKLFVEGHTDASGNDKINNPLSLKRANAVKAYLVAQKIDAARLTAEGFGSSKPIADNKTAKGKALNRRVDFKVQE